MQVKNQVYMNILYVLVTRYISGKNAGLPGLAFLACIVLQACGGGNSSGMQTPILQKTAQTSLQTLPPPNGEGYTVYDGMPGNLVATNKDSSTNPSTIRTLLDTPVPAPSVCPYLQSGKFTVFSPSQSDARKRVQNFDFNTATLTSTDPFGRTRTFSMVYNQPCKFTHNDQPLNYFVASKTGMFVNFTQTTLTSTNTFLVDIGFPSDGATTLGQAAGTYVFAQYKLDPLDGLLKFTHGIAKLDKSGEFSMQDCGSELAGCAASQRVTRFGENANGLFEDAENVSKSSTGRLLFHRAAPDKIDTIFMLQPGNQGFLMGRRQTARTLPAVGSVSSYWDIGMNPSGISSGAGAFGPLATIANDSIAGSYIRKRPNDGRTDTLTVNTPYNGISYKPSTVSTLNNGTTITLSSILATSIPSAGVGFYGRATTTAAIGFYGLSIDKLSRFSGTNYREIYKYFDTSGSFGSLGTATVGLDEKITVDGNTHRISDFNNTATSGAINFYPQNDATTLTSVSTGFNSRIVMLCNNVVSQSATKGTHLLIPDNALPASLSELGTRTFRGTEDCQSANNTLTFALDGSAQLAEGTVTSTINILQLNALVSADGLTQTDTASGNIGKTQLKLYKAASPGLLGSQPNVFYILVFIGRNVTNPNNGYITWFSQL